MPLTRCMVASLHTHKYEVFRNLLIQARKDAQLTQIQLASRLNKPQSYISKYEGGERRLDFTEFVEIANLLHIDITKFVTDYRDKFNI